MDIEVHRAMVNSYRVIIQGYDPAIIIEKSEGWFIHHPADKIEKITLEVLLEYFEEEEDYDRCVSIRNFIEKEW